MGGGGGVAWTEFSYSETFGTATPYLRVDKLVIVFCKFTFGKDQLSCHSPTSYLFTAPQVRDTETMLGKYKGYPLLHTLQLHILLHLTEWSLKPITVCEEHV
jgi:hypothetical protein